MNYREYEGYIGSLMAGIEGIDFALSLLDRREAQAHLLRTRQRTTNLVARLRHEQFAKRHDRPVDPNRPLGKCEFDVMVLSWPQLRRAITL